MLVNFRPPKIVRLLEQNRQELRKVRSELAPQDDKFYQKAHRTFISQHSDVPGNEEYKGPKRTVKAPKLPPKASAKASKSKENDQIVTEATLVKWQHKEDLLRQRTALRTEDRERMAQRKRRMEQKPRKPKKLKKSKMAKLLRGRESGGSESSGSESGGSESSGSESSGSESSGSESSGSESSGSESSESSGSESSGSESPPLPPSPYTPTSPEYTPYTPHSPVYGPPHSPV